MDLPDPEIKPGSPALQADSLPAELPGKTFYVLAIVNSTTVNSGVCRSFSVMVFSGYMPRSGIVGSYGSFTPSFLKEYPYHLPIVAISIYIPTKSAGAFPFLDNLSMEVMKKDFLMTAILTGMK